MRKLVVLVLLALVAVAPASALATKYWVADVYPTEGSTTQTITILVRMSGGEETTGTSPRYVYVFYDGALIKSAVASAYVSSTGLYTYKWDISMTVPQTAQATAYGEHTVTIRLEESDGSYTEKEVDYEVTSGAPVGEWYASLPDSFWVKLWEKMPQNVKEELRGETGATGADGAPGEDGRDATINYAQLADNIAYDALWDQMPKAELKGEKGDTGPAGRDADQTLTYLNTGATIIIAAALLYPKVKNKLAK